jgi:hypothetical protein
MGIIRKNTGTIKGNSKVIYIKRVWFNSEYKDPEFQPFFLAIFFTSLFVRRKTSV